VAEERDALAYATYEQSFELLCPHGTALRLVDPLGKV
jgi:hypothetical protein